MLPYSDYKKARNLFDIFFFIKSGQATTKKELANIFDVSVDTIENYVDELNSDFHTGIYIRKGTDNYIIEQEGIMGLLKRNYPITADDVMIIITSLMQSQAFMETKMSIIQNSLLGLLPEEESKKLRDMLHFEKSKVTDDQSIEYNMTKIRKAIAEEKKVNFVYKNSEGTRKMYKVIPYSFACDLGKFYIICKPDNKDFLTHLRIDRMGEVKILEEEGKRQEEFNVHNYLKKTWYMYSGPETKVLVRFKSKCKQVVTERNMSEGKVISENENYFDYEFICNGTMGIKIWLLGFGGDAEVLEPVELREEMVEELKVLMKIYMQQ